MTERILFSIHPRYLITRIAENSTILNDIQDAGGGDSFSIAEGYPDAYAKPFASGGKPLNRSELNNVFNLLSQLHFYWQMGGAPLWDRRVAEGQGLYAPLSGYPRNARVHKMIGRDLIEFISQHDNNMVEPVLGDPTNWKKVTLGEDVATKTELLALSGNAKNADVALAGAFSELSSTVKSELSSLSGNAQRMDASLSRRISELSSGTGGVISAIEQRISNLSSDAKNADESLASSISTLAEAVENQILTLSSTVQSELSSLSGNAQRMDEYLESQIIELSSMPKEGKVLNVVSDKTSVIEILEETGHGGETFHAGDVLIVTNTVSSCQYRSAYDYDGKDWCAFNGNVDASKVLINTDLDLAGNYKSVGNLDKGSTGATVKNKFPKGTSVQEIITQLIDQTVAPSIKSYPSNSITLRNGSRTGAVAGEVEVGNKFTPYYEISFSDGKFTCAGTDTNAGCSDSEWKAIDTLANSSGSKSGGIYGEFTVGDGTVDPDTGTAAGVKNYRVSSVTTYGVSNKAKNNKGTETSLVIPASSTASASSTTVSGIRYMFWGMDAGTGTVDSATIRALGTDYAEHRKKPASGTLPRLFASSKDSPKRCIVAIPKSSNLEVTEVKLPSSLGADITDQFIEQPNVSVKGFNDYPGVDYRVWIYSPAVIASDEEYDITIG